MFQVSIRYLFQVVFTGFAYGGLSELSETEYTSCSMGSTIAGEIGTFGYRPSVLMDMLAGKRAEVGTKVGAYMRTFSGDCSPSDLETALQVSLKHFLIHAHPNTKKYGPTYSNNITCFYPSFPQNVGLCLFLTGYSSFINYLQQMWSQGRKK